MTTQPTSLDGAHLGFIWANWAAHIWVYYFVCPGLRSGSNLGKPTNSIFFTHCKCFNTYSIVIYYKHLNYKFVLFSKSCFSCGVHLGKPTSGQAHMGPTCEPWTKPWWAPFYSPPRTQMGPIEQCWLGCSSRLFTLYTSDCHSLTF